MKKILTVLLYFGVVLFLAIAGFASCTEERSASSEALNHVADKIVAMTEFGIDTVEHRSYGDYAWFVDPGWCSESSTSVLSALLIDSTYSGDSVMLGVASAASDFYVALGDEYLQISSDAGLQIERTDYELITYPTYVDITQIIRDRPPEGLSVKILFPAHERVRKVFLSIVDSRSRMIHPAFSFIGPGENERIPFVCAKGTYEPPPQLTLSGRLNYSDWRYYTGTFLTALTDVSSERSDMDYTKYVADHMAFFNANVDPVREYVQSVHQLTGPFTLYYRFKMLDDMGPQAAAVLSHLEKLHSGDIEAIVEDDLYKYAEKSLDHIMSGIPRLSDGTLVRVTPVEYTVQSDDLFMAGLPLVRAYKVLGDERYIEEAVRQLNLFHKHLWNPETGLYYHCYFHALDEHGCCHWGRGMGWMMLVYSEVLQLLPPDHPSRAGLIAKLDDLLESLVSYQTPDGFWHQIITDSSSYAETSSTAMFVKALADAVYFGWIDNSIYREAAIRGADALVTTIDENGDIQGIVRGTPIFPSAEDYVNHSARTNDPRGMGALLWAYMSVERLGSE